MKRQIGLKVALLIGAVSLGLLAKMGAAYLHYVSNDKALYTPITNLAIDSSVPTYAAMKVLQFVGTKVWNATRKQQEKEIIVARDRLITALENKLDQIPRMTKTDREIFGQSLIDVCQKKPTDCVDMAMDLPKEIPLAYPKRNWANIPGYAIGSVGALSAVCGLGYIGYLGFEKWGLGQNLSIGLGTATGMVFGQVFGSLVPGQTARLLRTFCYFGFEPDLSDVVAPKMSAIFKTSLFATTFLVWGSAVDAANTYFTGYVQTAAKVTWAIASVAIVIKPFIDFQTGITERIAAKRLGTDQEKAVVSYTIKMRKLLDVLKDAPLVKVAAFLKELPESTWEHVIGNSYTGREVFDPYIEQHGAKIPLIS